MHPRAHTKSNHLVVCIRCLIHLSDAPQGLAKPLKQSLLFRRRSPHFLCQRLRAMCPASVRCLSPPQPPSGVQINFLNPPPNQMFRDVFLVFGKGSGHRACIPMGKGCIFHAVTSGFFAKYGMERSFKRGFFWMASQEVPLRGKARAGRRPLMRKGCLRTSCSPRKGKQPSVCHWET